MATHYIFPRQPTILADRDYFELSPNNLFLSANVSYISGPLGIYKLIVFL